MDSTQKVRFPWKRVETTVTNRGLTISLWISNVRSLYPESMELIVGLDCKRGPKRRRGVKNPTATLQLCVGQKCIIIQLAHLDYIPRALRSFLSDKNVVFVGVEIDQDAANLRRDYGLNCGRVVDLGLKDLVSEVGGIDSSKFMAVCSNDWDARVLGELLIEYATFDAYASYKVGRYYFKEHI